jgi:SAM-dependent methyltransferase
MAESRSTEITDLLVGEPGGGVDLADVERRLRLNGQRRAARIVRRIPAPGRRLGAPELDALRFAVHCELQRLEEELQLPRLVAEHLEPLVADTRRRVGRRDVTILDVGCGLAYLLRWLSLRSGWDPAVRYVGIDLDGGLLRHATRLATDEGARCEFREGDARFLDRHVDDPDGTVVVSSGLMHHLDPQALPTFFAAHERGRISAFAHWDLTPTRWAVAGSWVYHRARARLAIARHDGVTSTHRAYPASTLLAAARRGAPSYVLSCVDGSPWRPNPIRVLRPITGMRVASPEER